MEYRLKSNKLIEYIFILGSILVMFRGQTILVKFSNIILLILSFLALCSNFKNGLFCIKRKEISLPICLFLIFGCLSIMWSADPQSSKIMVYIFFTMLLIMQYNFSDNFWKKFLKYGEIASIITAISVFLEMINPNLFISVFRFILFRPSNALNQAMLGEYSGIAGGNAHAAVILNFGFAISLAKCYVKNKMNKMDVIKFTMLFIAIFLTGKRALVITPILMLIIYYCSGNTINKYSKLIMFILISGFLGYILIQINPSIADAIDKFVQGESDTDILTGRGNFWKICIVMFREKTLCGYGIAAFNYVFFEKTHYLFAGIPWGYHAHSIYYQICAELGILGISMFVWQLVVVVFKYINFLKAKHCYTDEKKFVMLFGIFVTLFLAVYGLTGNVLYETDELFGMIIGISAIEFVLRNKDKKNYEE